LNDVSVTDLADVVDTVLAWHTAVNTGDVERLVSLSSSDIQVAGPRGSDRGERVLRDWFARAGIRLEPLQTFGRDHVLVVEQRAAWPGPSGPIPQTVASVFEVADGRVTSVSRYADLDSALAAAGLTRTDGV
jgi:hypothetical protein